METFETNDKYPIGQQDFKTLRERGLIYIDKTRFVRKIADDGSQYFFLARPRRFGKSLFLSTLQYFFEGRRDLFQGLYIDSSEWDWKPYPVLRLDLNRDGYRSKGELDAVFNNTFKKWEAEYGVNDIADTLSGRFENIIEAAHRKTGRQVVILVDEYDKPMVANINNHENIDHYREKLSSVYSNFKSSAEHIRLVFLTGVSRFGKLSVFSDLNNLDDISFEDEYSDICGITGQEMLDNLQNGIARFASVNDISIESTLARLKKNYDGYRFAEKGSEIYNPWSLLYALRYSKIYDKWNDTGMPKVVAESLKRVNADLESMFDSYCTLDDLKGLDLMTPQPRALLYQTGYLTIKSYHPKIKRFRLGIPNEEVKKGLFNVLLPYYVKCRADDGEASCLYDENQRREGQFKRKRWMMHLIAGISLGTACGKRSLSPWAYSRKAEMPHHFPRRLKSQCPLPFIQDFSGSLSVFLCCSIEDRAGTEGVELVEIAFDKGGEDGYASWIQMPADCRDEADGVCKPLHGRCA